MVAMALTAILSIVIYGLFDSAADSLGEVDSLTETNGQLRFAIERLRTDVQAAGSQATPDSANDLWVRPQIPPASGRVLGISSYQDWQNDTSMFDATANPDVSADGFIVMGAYDYPVSFEFGGMTAAGDDGKVLATPRGLFKIFSLNPFRIDSFPGVDFSTNGFVNYFSPQWDTRLLRVMDSEGYFQFGTLDPITPTSDYIAGSATQPAALGVPLDTTNGPQLVYKTGGGILGLDVDSTGETYYDAGLIDAFWYHVVPSVQNPGTAELVRDRLCAYEVFDGLSAPNTFDPTSALAGAATCGDTERVVIAERVADFQIWFDCSNGGAVREVTAGSGAWSDDWDRPTGGACMAPGTYNPERARLAHIRLTIHAKSERENLAHYRFEDATGATGGAVGDDSRLRTYDIVPDLEGAAPVATMQTSVELKNFSYRL